MEEEQIMSLETIDDLFCEKGIFMRKEDMLVSPSDKYIFAIDSTYNGDSGKARIDSDKLLKYIYLEDPEQENFTIGNVGDNKVIDGASSSEFIYGSGSNKKYFKIVIYNKSNKLKPIFYELYHYNNGSFEFVENSSSSATSGLSSYNCSMTIDRTNKKIVLNCTDSSKYVLGKIFEIE